MAEKTLLLNGKKFHFNEIVNYSFRNSIPLNGYEVKTLEFCRNWLNGIQEFPIQTSGSTGVPKPITLTRQQLEVSARRTLRILNLEKDDSTLICLNTEYIAGMMMLVRGFLAELEMIIIDPVSNPLSLIPADKRIDFGSFVPLQLQTIIQETPERIPQLSQMKGILVGGAPVNDILLRQIQQIKAPVYHTYGMTETASHIALRLLNGNKPIEYYEVLSGIEIGLDKRGCLTVKGDITNNELLVTNDLVELLTPTRFRWIGRADNTINTGGVKVQLEKIEKAVAESLAIQENSSRFFVATQPDELLGEKIILVLESEPLTAEAEQDLIATLRSMLKKFEVPRQVIYSNGFSETATGKVSRQRTMQKLGLETT